jgi:hypothetical protein
MIPPSKGGLVPILRSLALAAAAGAVVGLLIGGIWGRAFMFLLAQLNPEEHGIDTDDGFAMGQFTLVGTLNLLVVTTIMGAIGGLLFLGLRGLRFGPTWFRTASLPLGGVIVVGGMLVHSDGVDFDRLEPVGLAVALTLSVPLLFTLGVVWLGDRWLGDAPTFWQRLPAAVPWIARAGLTLLAVAATVDLAQTLADIFDDNSYS